MIKYIIANRVENGRNERRRRGKMWFVIIVLFLIIAIEALVQAFEIVFTSLPYVCMIILSTLLFLALEGLQNLIPGHGVMSYISVLAVFLFITFLLTRIKQISFSFVILCCTFLLCFIFAIYANGARPDSIAYCIFVSVAFSVVLFVAVGLNLVKYGQENEEIRNWFFSIVAGILNALTVSCYIIAVGLLWDSYFTLMSDEAGAVFGTIHFILLALGSLTAFVLTILFDRKLLKQEVANDADTYAG